jgi:hypothetical protein
MIKFGDGSRTPTIIERDHLFPIEDNLLRSLISSPLARIMRIAAVLNDRRELRQYAHLALQRVRRGRHRSLREPPDRRTGNPAHPRIPFPQARRVASLQDHKRTPNNRIRRAPQRNRAAPGFGGVSEACVLAELGTSANSSAPALGASRLAKSTGHGSD